MADTLLDHYDLGQALSGEGIGNNLWSVIVDADAISADLAGSEMWRADDEGKLRRREILAEISRTRDAAAAAGDGVLANRLTNLAEAMQRTIP
ncbi:hypothetical protein [Microbacterium testaceum]|uniref:hypothetical protein n=1 Tax=Microbacterium testaceum TaxID=2033 RepID=UPI002AC5F008|nr:hypothetical protein [Microbacterium testaceum]MDZ5144588.1 hypothetical protein [Microbacterium testaceum]